VFGQYGNFINDPAAQIASQFGQTAFRQGQEYIEQNVSQPRLPHPSSGILMAMARTNLQRAR
jgi:hypothetical protein